MIRAVVPALGGFLPLIGRWSDFAVQHPDGSYRRAGRPLTQQDLTDHLSGVTTLGTYVINEDGMCRFAVFDADADDGLVTLQTLQRRLAVAGLASALECSRRGGHLWVFCDRPLPASQVRAWLRPWCPAGVEFYPKQAEGGGYGSLIRLPLGIHQKSGRRYPFVAWDTHQARLSPVAPTVEAQLHWVLAYPRVPVPASRLTSVQERAHPVPSPTHKSFAPTALRHLSYSPTTIAAWCAMQDPFQIIGACVPLTARGMGCCPFGAHHTHGKDRHPSFKVYMPTRPGGSSWYCYTWQRGGNVFDFLCHWHGVDAPTMWHAIQKGEHHAA